MEQERDRLIELYEKGALTKEEAKACFIELNADVDFLFEEEKPKFSLSRPTFRIFSSSKLKQRFSFQDIESMKIRLSQGRIDLIKNKSKQVDVFLVYPHQTAQDQLPNIYIEQEKLFFDSKLPCRLTIALPEQWMSVLDLELGCANARLDFLPFEDISIHSMTDKKQQDVRITSSGQLSQYFSIQLAHANLSLHLPKKQGLIGRVDSKQGQVNVNRRKKKTPYRCEKQGDNALHLKVSTIDSLLTVKGIHDVGVL